MYRPSPTFALTMTLLALIIAGLFLFSASAAANDQALTVTELDQLLRSQQPVEQLAGGAYLTGAAEGAFAHLTQELTHRGLSHEVTRSLLQRCSEATPNDVWAFIRHQLKKQPDIGSLPAAAIIAISIDTLCTTGAKGT